MPFGAGLAQPIPLLLEGELQNPFLCKLASVFCVHLSQRLRLSAAQRLRPLGPRAGFELAAQQRVKRVVVQPARLVFQELLEVCPLIGQGLIVEPAIEKITGGLVKQRQLAPLHFFEIDAAAASGQARNSFAIDPTPIGKQFQADERRVSGKCRCAGIRRVSVSRGTKRQYLPNMLFGLRQESDKFVCGRAKVADSSI